MKVLLDTSYLFPLLGVEVEIISNEQLYTALSSPNDVFYYADLSIFELTAKILKEIWRTNNEIHHLKKSENEAEEALDLENPGNLHQTNHLMLSPEYDLEYLNQKLDGLLHFDNPKRLIWYYNPHMLDLLYELRNIHHDFIDCAILFTAVVYCDCFATIDRTFIQTIRKNQKIVQLLRNINPNFSFWMDDLTGKPQLL
jgi:hypothetical protein